MSKIDRDNLKGLFNQQLDNICNDGDILKPKAFARWVCKHIVGIKDERGIDGAILDGSKDTGLDVFYADNDPDNPCIYLVQTKFSASFERKIKLEEIEYFAGSLMHMRLRSPGTNSKFKEKSEEFSDIIKKNPTHPIRMIFAAAGKKTDHVNNNINPKWINEKFPSNVTFEIMEIDDILTQINMPDTPEFDITFASDVIERKDPNTKKKSVIGYVRGSQLAKIAEKYRSTIFLENPRESLGATATNKEILDALENENTRSKFWKLNNGITATCNKLVPSKPTRSRKGKKYRVANFKIVNGLQTTQCILKSKNKPLCKVTVLVVLHESPDDDERNQISAATNTQNRIRPADLVAHHSSIISLAVQCQRKYPNYYFERQRKGFDLKSEKERNRITPKRVLTKVQVARNYYAYKIHPHGAIKTSENSMFSVTPSGPFTEVFIGKGKNRQISELIIPNIFMNAIAALSSKWKRDAKNNRSGVNKTDAKTLDLRIVKYFTLRYISLSMDDISRARKKSVEKNIIRTFGELGRRDSIPKKFLDVAEEAYLLLKSSFTEVDKGAPCRGDLFASRVKTTLDDRGNLILRSMLQSRKKSINKNKSDPVKDKLLAFADC